MFFVYFENYELWYENTAVPKCSMLYSLWEVLSWFLVGVIGRILVSLKKKNFSTYLNILIRAQKCRHFYWNTYSVFKPSNEHEIFSSFSSPSCSPPICESCWEKKSASVIVIVALQNCLISHHIIFTSPHLFLHHSS